VRKPLRWLLWTLLFVAATPFVIVLYVRCHAESFASTVVAFSIGPNRNSRETSTSTKIRKFSEVVKRKGKWPLAR